MIDTNPNAIAKFRATTAGHVPYSHVRKRCGCNRVVTAIQLQRYGMCMSCYRQQTSKASRST